MTYRKFIYLTFVFSLVSGCATINSIHADYSRVNYEDGISRSEAKSIAQKTLLDLGKNKSYIVSMADVEDRATEWKVIFSSAHLNKLAYIINVDKRTGEVTKPYKTEELCEVFQR